jgi:triphosphatase
MGVEVEVKFRLGDPTTFSALARARTIGAFTLKPENEQHQRNIYYDTTVQGLAAAGYGLRVRWVGTRALVTLKCREEAHEGLFRRMEWEFEGDDPHPSAWEDGEAKTRLLPLVGAYPLVPSVETHTLRRPRLVARAGNSFAELCLDTGKFVAGDRRESFAEIEVELLDAERRSDFDAFVVVLRDRYGLIAENRSKLARALALASS